MRLELIRLVSTAPSKQRVCLFHHDRIFNFSRPLDFHDILINFLNEIDTRDEETHQCSRLELTVFDETENRIAFDVHVAVRAEIEFIEAVPCRKLIEEFVAGNFLFLFFECRNPEDENFDTSLRENDQQVDNTAVLHFLGNTEEFVAAFESILSEMYVVIVQELLEDLVVVHKAHLPF